MEESQYNSDTSQPVKDPLAAILADKEQSENGSKTETTLILCGYSRERANNRGDNYKRGGEEKKNEKICLQAIRKRTIRQTVQRLRPL